MPMLFNRKVGLMNPFLEKFEASSNEDLHQKIISDPKKIFAFDKYEHDLISYHDKLSQSTSISNSKAMKRFFSEHNFYALGLPTLVLFNTQYQPIAKIDLLNTKSKALSAEAAAEVINTPYAAQAALHLPQLKSPELAYEFSKEVERKLATIDISLIDTLISTNKEVVAFSEVGLYEWNVKHDPNQPAQEFITPEIFNDSCNYLTGYHEYKQHAAEKQIIDLHIHDDDLKIKDILISTYKTQPYETANVIFFDQEGYVKGMDRLTAGTATRTSVYPTVVAQRAIEYDAHAFTLVHNHPSGQAEASPADIALTKHIRQVADLIDKPIVDHYIVAGNEICSFVELNLLQEYRGFEEPELER